MVIGKRDANERVGFGWRNPLTTAQGGLPAQNTGEPPHINRRWFSRCASDELIRP